MSTEPAIKVGDTLWTRDMRNTRKGWESKVITGDTKLSWVVDGGRGEGSGRKILKKTMLENHGQWGKQRWFTPLGMNDEIWLRDHRRNIADAVRGCETIESLKKIAEILGWTPK